MRVTVFLVMLITSGLPGGSDRTKRSRATTASVTLLGLPRPAMFMAITLNSYSSPSIRPVTLQSLSLRGVFVARFHIRLFLSLNSTSTWPSHGEFLLLLEEQEPRAHLEGAEKERELDTSAPPSSVGGPHSSVMPSAVISSNLMGPVQMPGLPTTFTSLISSVVTPVDDSTHILPVSPIPVSPFFQVTLGMGMPMIGMLMRVVLPSFTTQQPSCRALRLQSGSTAVQRVKVRLTGNICTTLSVEQSLRDI
ncbi:hypothetical protein F7725_002634 [Dissostichus mawsoni]|uniref:Uncharacterized protein n=1 Tax=Dissostichus mawsoni TaxID=36200 RepID=A0A7J5Y2X5_DISMA|nr:hypothetical protein F7725_002634 [Dissostichus mawsoni]